jgi:hypothetical protein
MEMGRVARQNDNAAGRIRLHRIAIKLIAEADVENAGDDCVDPVLWVSVWHQLHTRRHFDPDRVRTRLRGLPNNNGEACRRWESWELLPVDVFRQDRFKTAVS